MLSETELADYHENGYIIPDYKLPTDAIARIRDCHHRLVEAHPEFSDYCSSVLEYDLGFLNFARDPFILDAVGQILGPNFALWNSSFFAKPARIGRRTPWHQDGEYWPIRPIATCTAWIAVDASTKENGCLRVIRGSHKARRIGRHETNSSSTLTLNQELSKEEYNEEDAVDLELAEGQISLHDVYLIHGSEANTSVHPRRGMTLRFMPTTSVFDRDLAHSMHGSVNITDHARRTLFLMRGTDLSGRNDFQMRH